MADDLPEDLRNDLRITIRALDIEVQRLVNIIERAEALIQGRAPRRPPTTATPLQTPAARQPTRFEEREPDEDEERA